MIELALTVAQQINERSGSVLRGGAERPDG
jgi:hypothetical protein